MMNESWYEEVDPDAPLTQGDLIFDCPVVVWTSEPVETQDKPEGEVLRRAMDVKKADVVVMTQACDLKQAKVRFVTLCHHFSLGVFKEAWKREMEARRQVATEKAWKKHCESIREGYIWNLAMLNEGKTTSLSTDHRIVDFHYVYTAPRIFIESLVEQRVQSKLRLLPPYREHLSQAFARFYMRVGLPVDVRRVWMGSQGL